MPSSGQPEPAHVRRPLVDALSFVWAIVPIVSFGFATSLVFAFAAYRMRSRAVAIAAACYLAVPVTLIVTAPIRNFATDDWQNQVALWTWVAGPWFGGTVYALIIRRRVFPLGPTGPQTMRSSSWNPWRDSVPPLRNTPTRPLAGPAGIAVPLSYVWALVPLLTLGFATCLTIGSAAVRLRSRTQGMAAAGYVLLLAVFVASNEPISALTSTDWRAQAVFWGWSLTSWWGGTFHAFYLRQAVFTRRRLARPLSVDSRIGVVGPYQLLSQLGQGGQGTVYLALAPDGARVAVKVLHASPDVWSREHTKFLREVEVAKRVPSFATAPVLDVGTEGDVAYIVSEYVDGPSLETLVRGGDPMGPDSLTRLALWTATALRGIHSAGVVHRDFKPANVLLATDGPRVIDFGISKALDHLRTTTQGIQGTPIYMSPEQVSGQAVGPASDVFSWAATMYFAATGRSPFDASTAPAVFYKVMHHQPDLSVLPPALRPHLARCFSRNPASRPQAMELVMAISAGGTGTAGKA